MTSTTLPGRFSILTAALAACLALTGCGSSAQKTFTYDAPLGKPIAVDIENVRGDVIVRGDGDSSAVTVEASRFRAGADEHPGDDEIHRNDRWLEEDLSVEFIEQEGGSVLRVRPGALNEERNVRVDLWIELPTLDGVEIRNKNGQVVLVDARGAMRVHNQMGPIDIRTSHPVSQDMDLTTTAGNIYVQMPTDSNAEADLLTLDGLISMRDKEGTISGPHTNGSNTFTGFINAGGNAITCRTDEGDIYVWVMEDPMSYTRADRNNYAYPYEGWFLKGSRRHTRELPEDHPEITNYQFPGDSGY